MPGGQGLQGLWPVVGLFWEIMPMVAGPAESGFTTGSGIYGGGGGKGGHHI